MTNNYEYEVGGSLKENAPSYVVRQADSDLYDNLKAGVYCYIFNSRQMGKTSLIVRTMKKLQADGYACTSLDFSVRGSRDVKLEQWYAGILYKLVVNFNIGNPSEYLRNWWQERGAITPVERLEEFIETVLLTSIQSKIIIFIDEIDSILSLSFSTDDFFALIRSCYQKRTLNPEYDRLTFALVGVATPGDLIGDKRRTPFNIGKAIGLDGFKESEIEPLAKGFSGYVENPLALMQDVLAWTGGQPFLTQKVCQLLIQNPTPNPSPFTQWPLRQAERGKEENKIFGWVESIIRSKIIENWESQDEPEHLKTIRDRLLLGEQIAGRFLGWYQQILLLGHISADGSIEQMRFRLTGLVFKQQDKVKVYNKIYKSVFDLKWVEKELDKLRPYSENFQAWIASNYQDESRLLRGQALQDALRWANEKNLSNEDAKYLAASQELEKRELEAALAVQKEESRILAQANDTLTIASKKAKRRIRLGSIILGVSLVAAIIAGTFAGTAELRRQEATIVTTLEQSSAQLLRLPTSSLVLENLIEAMRPARRLRKLVKDGHYFKDYPTISPVLALQTTLDNIREKNQLEGSSVVFSPDGQTVATISENNTVKLWNLKGLEIATLKHQKGVKNVVFSPDGKTVATAEWDGTAKLWNLKGSEIATLKHQNSVINVVFSPDGKTVATASFDGTAKLWNLKGSEIATLKHQNSVINVVFSPDGKTVATASFDGTAKLWNLKGSEIATLKHQRLVNYVAFSPDGKTVATASDDKTAKLWNFKGSEIATLKHQDTVNDVVFSPDGKTVATASNDKTAKLWNFKGSEIATLKHQYWVTNVVFSPDGKTVATASNDKTAKLWNFKGSEIATLKHQDTVNDVVFSPDGKTVATASIDNTAKLWNLKGSEIVTLKHQGSVNDVVFSPDGKTVATASNDKTAKLWNFKGLEIATLKHQDIVNNVVFSPDGKTVATASNDNTAKLWNLEGEELATLKHQDIFNNVVFSPDGKTVATASYDGTAKLWNLEGEELATLKHQHNVNNVVFSPDGKTVATASSDKTAKLWNLEGEELATLKHQDIVNNVVFSPDGKTVATASYDNTAKLWNLKGSELATLKHQDRVTKVVFSPDGQTVATASGDNTAKLWNLKGSEIATLKHQSWVTKVVFSPDGQTVATASGDNTAKLWNLKGSEIATLKHQDAFTNVVFSPDGKTVATASYDNTAKLWNFKGSEIATLKHQDRVTNVVFSPDGKTVATASSDNIARLWTQTRDGWQQVAEYQGEFRRFNPDGNLIALIVDDAVQLRRVEGLDDLLARGCNWLQDYLNTHDNEKRKELCPGQ
ncbi:eIF2A-related protein [Dulcicalothrix desertica]|uniref:eIF2A-related protein n=5 Tax=Dulcicalothrix desertica TaxID=32056 RepID=UPI001C9A18A3|nr:AAA-like domain-containing protein [Dulcicalothrix desertica]